MLYTSSVFEVNENVDCEREKNVKRKQLQKATLQLVFVYLLVSHEIVMYLR